MLDTIAMIVAIVIVVVGIVWAVWFENFAGRDVFNGCCSEAGAGPHFHLHGSRRVEDITLR